MKRYIEVVFDDSGSMACKHLSGKPKHEVAKNIFHNSVLPMISGSQDTVALRLLRNSGCDSSRRKGSHGDIYDGDPKGLSQAVDRISGFNKRTPLYLTIRDALDQCAEEKNKGKYTSFKVFVLTDGGDTCSDDFHNIISRDEVQKWNIEFPDLEPVLVQFDVSNAVTRNNLTSAIRRLGGRSVSISDATPRSIKAVSATLRKAGFKGTGKLSPCIESAPTGPSVTWEKLIEEGILFHQAKLLRESRILDFNPEIDKPVSADEAVALRFVHAIAFGSTIPLVLVRTMLAQLERPLLYTHDCIQWNFKLARWEQVQPPEQYEFLEDPSVHGADNPADSDESNPTDVRNDQNDCWFDAKIDYYVKEKQGKFCLSKHPQTDIVGGNKCKLTHGKRVRFEFEK